MILKFREILHNDRATRDWMMKRKRYNRRKRIIIAYTLRAIVGLVLAGMITLMVCGVLFIYEKVSGNVAFGKIAEASAGENKRSSSSEELWGNATDQKNLSSEYKEYCIILDAGHGGSDGGTLAEGVRSDDNQRINAIEKDISLAVVLRMQTLLEELGVEVVLTREDDITISLDERVEIANSKEADLFVSIHCNFFKDDASVSGLECYYFKGSDSGRRYAEKMLNKIADGGKVNTRNTKESDFYVLRRTESIAVLVELGYLSNAKECRLLVSEEYQETLAKELVNGILDALKQERLSNE